MFKNVATKIALFAFDSATGLGKAGDAANLTAYVSKDYGTVTALADTSATEMDATNAKGWYLFDVAQAESNADTCLFTAKSSTSGVSVVGQYIHTTPANFTSLSVNGSGQVDAIKFAGQTITAAAPVTLPASVAAVGSAMTLTSGERTSVADALLDRDMGVGTDSGSTTVRTVRQALRALRNKVAAVAGTLTIYKEDDSTASFTAALTSDAAAVPITAIDPAGP